MGGSFTPATSNMELFKTLAKGWKSLIKITQSAVVDATGIIDPSLLLLKQGAFN